MVWTRDGYGLPWRHVEVDMLGRAGTVRRISGCASLNVDVLLDDPLPDRRRHLYFDEYELEVTWSTEKRAQPTNGQQEMNLAGRVLSKQQRHRRRRLPRRPAPSR